MTPRSWLYVPGGAEDKLAKAAQRGADALIVDLEDAVPPAQRPAARTLVRSWLDALAPGSLQVWVRVNPGAEAALDIAAVAGAAALTGVVAAKVETVGDLERVDAELSRHGRQDHRVVPMLESGAAVLRAVEIAGAPRVQRLQVGEVDLMADLGVHDGAQDDALGVARGLVVLASAAAGVEPPVAPVSRELRDMDAFGASSRRLRAAGFLGRACVHPAQVAVVNAVFTPTSEEIDRARDVVERSAAAGGGVTVDGDGGMIDEAVVRQARRLLSLVR